MAARFDVGTRVQSLIGGEMGTVTFVEGGERRVKWDGLTAREWEDVTDLREVTGLTLDGLHAALDDADDVLAEVAGVGGNCIALVVQLPDGGEMLVTEESGPVTSGSDDLDELLVGRYDAEHEWMREVYLGKSVAECAAAIIREVRG